MISNSQASRLSAQTVRRCFLIFEDAALTKKQPRTSELRLYAVPASSPRLLSCVVW